MRIKSTPESAVGTGPTLHRLATAVLGLVVAGAVAQVLMSSFYLAVAHAPTPHQVPVGLVAPTSETTKVASEINAGGKFKTQVFPTSQAMITAIKHMTVYGGVDITGTPHLYIASAAGTTAANTLRAGFSDVVDQRTQQQVAELAAHQASVPIQDLRRLAAPPSITDVVALPKNDSFGSSIALLVQAIALGATVASMGLGRIGAGTTPSLRRAAGHLLALVSYAVVSAAAVIVAAHAFGVVPTGSNLQLFLSFALLSLAVTGSVAGLVSLIGPRGAFLGSAYFLFGVPIAGGSVLPAFLPGLARVVGQALPTGAGVTLVRESLYFPDASIAKPIWVLVSYAAVGIALVVTGNAIGNRVGGRAATESS